MIGCRPDEATLPRAELRLNAWVRTSVYNKGLTKGERIVTETLYVKSLDQKSSPLALNANTVLLTMLIVYLATLRGVRNFCLICSLLRVKEVTAAAAAWVFNEPFSSPV
jgi:hypothetical protein